MKLPSHYLSPSQAAEIIGVTRPGFLKMIERKDIAVALTLGKQRFFLTSAVYQLKRNRDKLKAKANGKK